MKKILNFLENALIFFVVEMPSRLKKKRLIYYTEIKLLDLEHKYSLDKSVKTLRDISDTKRILNAINKCPSVVLIYEIDQISKLFDSKEITNEICKKFISKIESHSNINQK